MKRDDEVSWGGLGRVEKAFLLLVLAWALLFFSGLLLMCWNLVKTVRTAPADFAVEPEVVVPPRVRDHTRG